MGARSRSSCEASVDLPDPERPDDRHGTTRRDRERDLSQRLRPGRIHVADLLEAQLALDAGEFDGSERSIGKDRRVQPFVDLADAAGQIEQVPLNLVQLVQQRQQAQQEETVPEEIAAEHQPRAHEKHVGTPDDRHRADHGEASR